jgi:bacterioferritin
MGTKGTSIVGLDVKELIQLLNRAYADEWLAYYQYWVGAQVAKGPMRGAVVAELMEHANDEFKHAEMLAKRILQLGGTPLLDPQDWFKNANCPYDAPKDPNVKTLIEQNIKGEQCAISVYKKIADLTIGKDLITHKMVLEILEDEVEHEDDLQNLLEDMNLMKGSA